MDNKQRLEDHRNKKTGRFGEQNLQDAGASVLEAQPVCETDEYGAKRWYLNDELHREDGPAVEWSDGGKEWWLDGQYHRLDGPAAEWSDGSKCWYVNDKRHRLDGPAIEWADGSKEWYLNGRRLDEETFEMIRSQRPSMARARTDVAIEDAVFSESKARWTTDEGETVREGTVRSGMWTAEGTYADRDTDPRDACVRITTSTGAEVFMPWRQVADLHEQSALAFR